jgi:hypothetical protein
MLVLVVAVESFVAANWLDFSDPVTLSWRHAANDAVHLAPGKDVLCMGDSLAKHGLIPQILESRSGLKVHNVAAARGPAPLSYFLLRRALEAGARPRALVIDFKPTVLLGGPDYHLRYWQEIVTPRECAELARAGRYGSFVAPLVVGRLLPTFRSRLEVRSNVMAALRGEHDPLYLINRVLTTNWEKNRGSNVAAKNPEFHDERDLEHPFKFVPRAWYCHHVTAAFFPQIFDLAAAHGIKVYWLIAPLSPELQRDREGSDNEAGYLRFARSMMAAHPNLTVLDARHAGFDASLFVDPTHLDGEGGVLLSTLVGDALRRDLAKPNSPERWVELKRGARQQIDTSLEDVEQTKLALKRALRIH